jgi:hypothetical protein
MTASETSWLEAGLGSAAWKPVTHPGKMLKLINEHLDHLRETKDLFDHLDETKDLFDHLRETKDLFGLHPLRGCVRAPH